MQTLASFIMKGRLQAILVAATTAMLGLLLPPMILISSAAIGLVTLRQGPKEGLTIFLGAVVGVAGLAWVTLNAPISALAFVPVAWLPLWIVAAVLWLTVSLPLALQAITLYGAIVVTLFHVVLPDPVVWWRDVLEQLAPALQAAHVGSNTTTTSNLIDALAPVMTGVTGSSLVMTSILALLLARWWQSVLYNPGGFAKEFYQFKLGRVNTLVAIAIFALAVLPGYGLFNDLSVLIFVPFMFQGLALIHALANKKRLHWVWLLALYVLLLFLLPQLVTLLALIGLSDNWIDFRRRLEAQDTV